VADGIPLGFGGMGGGEISLVCRLVSLGRRLDGDQSCNAVFTWRDGFEMNVAE
jgi:hypothetical protein